MCNNDNLTAVLYGREDLKLEQRPLPKCKDDEVLIRMECVGICGSDVHYLEHGRIGNWVVSQPMIIGHEASGTVVECGANVKNVRRGDRVAIEPGVSCKKCQCCREGRYNLCPDMKFCATPPVDGNLTRFYTHDADFCYKIPDHVTFEEAAMFEPLAVGVHACRRGDVRVGTVLLITGAGPIGILTMIVAKAMGCSKVIVTDIQQPRLELAKSLGADHVMKICCDTDEELVSKKIVDMLGEKPTHAIECSGAEMGSRLAMITVANGGRIVIVGMGPPEMKVPLIMAASREIDIFGCFRYANDYPVARDLIANRKINVKPLITHHYKMEEVVEAFKTARNPESRSVKVMIHANAEWKHN